MPLRPLVEAVDTIETTVLVTEGILGPIPFSKLPNDFFLY